MRVLLVFLLTWIGLCPSQALAQAPQTFREAKLVAKREVFFDQGAMGDLYCGCRWTWTGESGGRMDLAGCGYQARKDPNRAARLEWEHIVPASTFGRQRQCWQQGGREHCQATDPTFSLMEADLHNLYPAVGEVNADRSNLNYGVAAGPAAYGQCPTRVDFAARSAEPRDAAKGLVARATFYMVDRYGLRLSDQQVRLLSAWSRQFPVSAWERERNRRITVVTGVSNPFVDGRRSDPSFGKNAIGMKPAPSPAGPQAAPARVRGNRQSGIYHVQGRCPHYGDVGESNRVAFASEHAAQAAGYRLARNCRP